MKVQYVVLTAEVLPNATI